MRETCVEQKAAATTTMSSRRRGINGASIKGAKLRSIPIFIRCYKLGLLDHSIILKGFNILVTVKPQNLFLALNSLQYVSIQLSLAQNFLSAAFRDRQQMKNLRKHFLLLGSWWKLR
ncbi:uncharacterized protein LOC123888773 isoform X2 [Trifolium pratense]|uniref:uncharacterized protein LOC123888773 isoform X2 n=1 Tax=Trifolium pratense TaxID=57577 RepID=UPI001E697FEA|nr:uncharacterized protein LOC123888773 isoform X2 [Trifolium pratense]